MVKSARPNSASLFRIAAYLCRRPSPIFVKYLLVQVPGWLLLATVLRVVQPITGLSLWTSGLVVTLFVLKDLALYPLLRRSYKADPRTGGERLVGHSGRVATALSPEGYIRVRGELWRAVAPVTCDFLPEGAKVKICGARGLTLRVKPD